MSDKSPTLFTRILVITGAALLVLGLAFTKILAQPAYRSLSRMELMGESGSSPSLETPFYYITGSVPGFAPWMFPNLPYEKGLPKKFLPRLLFAASLDGEDLTGTLILSGPETLQSEMKWNQIAQCFAGWFQCVKMKKEFVTRVERILSERGVVLDEISWFHVRNPKIFPDEEPKGIRTVGITKSAEGIRVVETYFLLSAKNAIQAVSLEGPVGKTTIDPWLSQWVRTLRMTSDLSLQQLQAKSSIQKIRISQKSTDDVLRLSLVKLSSLLSVDPGNQEGWFHLAGVSQELNRRARATRHNLAEKRSRLLIQQVERYLRDIAPDSGRAREVATMKAELEK